MAKGAYIGVGGVARKVKKGYIGVGSAARKIKRAYIGVGGIARPCWSGGEIAYYGTVTPLSVARARVQGTTVGNYALFAGGQSGSAISSVEAYDKTLTRTIPAALSTGASEFGAATTGNYAICAGLKRTSTVDVYDADLTKSSRNDFGYTPERHRGAEAGELAVFAGMRQNDTTNQNGIVAYNGDLTRQTAAMTEAKAYVAMNQFCGKAIIAGGWFSGTSRSSKIEIVSEDLTVATAEMSFPRSEAVCPTSSKFLFIGEGTPGGSSSLTTSVEAFDKDMTRYSVEDLNSISDHKFGANFSDIAMFAGLGNTECYDDHLTKTLLNGLNPNRGPVSCGLRAPTIGDFALFGGGASQNGGTYYNAVDAFILS